MPRSQNNRRANVSSRPIQNKSSNNRKLVMKSKKQRRPRPRPQTVGDSLRSLGSGVGSMFGTRGAAIGRSAGDLASQVFGLGSYQIRSNSLLRINDQGPPSFRTRANGEIEVMHREFLQDIVGSTAFSNTSFSINPGLANTFPWLSSVASSFEEYEFLGLLFEFKSTSAVAVNSTNTALGVVIMATDYDALDSSFVTKVQMEAQQFTTSSVPSISFCHGIECRPRSNVLSSLYVRTTSVPSGADQRFYDLGNFQLATSGMQAAATIGELWVSYHVLLKKPQLPDGAEGIAHVTSNGATATAAAPLGLVPGLNAGSGTATVLLSSTTTLVLPLPGYYAISSTWYTANNNIAAVPVVSRGSNIAAHNLLVADGSYGVSNFAAGGGTSMDWRIVQVTAAGTGAGNTLTYSGNTSMTGANTDVFIIGLPNILT